MIYRTFLRAEVFIGMSLTWGVSISLSLRCFQGSVQMKGYEKGYKGCLKDCLGERSILKIQKYSILFRYLLAAVFCSLFWYIVKVGSLFGILFGNSFWCICAHPCLSLCSFALSLEPLTRVWFSPIQFIFQYQWKYHGIR